MADRVSVPTLVMTGGPLDGTSYPLPLSAGEAIVGSSMDAGVQIMLGNVEPFHARVVLGAAGLAIEDAGSATGTFVNGEKVEGRHALSDGDRVCLGPPGAKGSAKLLVLLPGAVRGPALATDAAAPSLDAQVAAPSFGEEPALAFSTEKEPGRTSTCRPTRCSTRPFSSRATPPDRRSRPPRSSPRTTTATRSSRDRCRPSRPRRRLAPRPPRASGPARGRGRPSAASPALRRTSSASTGAAAPGREADRSPPPPPPAPSRTEAPKPEYQTELPSIPVEHPVEPGPSEFPPLRPAVKPARGRGKGKGPRSASAAGPSRCPRMPIVPLLGGTAALAVVAGLVWFFFIHVTPPELVSIAPLKAEVGEAVTLTGKHFASEAAGNTVLFGAARAQVTKASDTVLEVVVPAGAKAQVPVLVETKEGRSSPVTLTVVGTALATGLEPDVALPGQVVLVKGAGFQGQKLTARVAGVVVTEIDANAEGVRVTIPAVPLPEGSLTTLEVQAGVAPPRQFDLYIGRLPLVVEVSPRRGAVGDTVVLQGRGFRPEPLANTVTFATQPALVLSATETELSVVAPPPPAGDIAPELPIVVTVGGRASAGTATYALVRGATSGFVPRFFAAPVTEFPGTGLVFVSTELGPVLLLGGPAEAASTTERAVKVAKALNALVEGAASRPPAFELRERPQPSVGVVGEVSPFLVPTPEDAAAYSRDWEKGRGGRRLGPAAVARHWAALLQDYFGLFLRRQRPLRMVAVSPRGKVLTEIYSEANRRSPGGAYVPSSLVLPTPAAMAENLRLMALVVSGEAGRSAVAVEGRWDGTIEDPDQGTRGLRAAAADRGRAARGHAHHLARRGRAQGPGARHRVRPRQRALHRGPAGDRLPLQGHARGEHRHRDDRARRQAAGELHPALRGVDTMARVRTGLEGLLDRPDPVRGLRVGLVVNPSSITKDLEHASVALAARRGVKLAALFGPEHGIAADAQDLVEVGHSPRPRDGAPGPQPLRRDPRAHAGRCSRASTRWSSTCRTWARATTPSPTRCSTSWRPARGRESASSSSTARTRSGATSWTATSSTPPTGPSSGCTRSRCATG